MSAKNIVCLKRHAKVFAYALLMPVLLVGLSACQSIQTYHKAMNATQDMQQRMQALDKPAPATPAPKVIVKQSAYIDQQPIDLKQSPPWLQKTVSLKAVNMPFAMLAKQLADNKQVYVDLMADVNPNRLVSIDFTGSLHNALHKLANKSGYAFTIDDHTIVWSAFKTQMFDISFMPGVSTYLVGKHEQTGNNGQNQNSLTNIDTVDRDSEYSNLSASLSVWKDLKQTLDTLKSKAGKVEVSQSTTTVTVYDHPANVRAIAHYLNLLNQDLSREVLIQVEVLELKLSKGFNYGVNWNLINGQFKLKGNDSQPIKINPIGGNDASGMGLGWGILANDGVKILLQALQQQGNLSTATYPRVITMNNQIAQIAINTETHYIAQTNTVATEQNVTTAVTPGVIRAGFTLYLLPKIQQKNVFLQISSTISQLLNIETKDFTDGNNKVNASIQLPEVSSKKFNQRSVVPNNHTLVLAGFKQLRSEANSSSLFGIDPLGGKGAENSNVETIILITPKIIQVN